jgi:hypothetical protein
MRKDISCDSSEPFILAEGPRWGDAQFYGKWLLAAAKAEALWQQVLSDPNANPDIERLTVCYFPHFGIAATMIIAQFEKELASIAIGINSEPYQLVEEFAMMVQMGFFSLTGQRYQMVIPKELTRNTVRKAAVKLAQTEDAEYYLHPERLLVAMPYEETKAWQQRLRHMDDIPRSADRLLLMNTDPPIEPLTFDKKNPGNKVFAGFSRKRPWAARAVKPHSL